MGILNLFKKNKEAKEKETLVTEEKVEYVKKEKPDKDKPLIENAIKLSRSYRQAKIVQYTETDKAEVMLPSRETTKVEMLFAGS